MKLQTAAIAALAVGFAGAAQAQDIQPKTKGTVIVNMRLTEVAPQGTDPIVTLAGAPTGLRADVGYDIMPTLGIAYFLTDNVAVDLTLGTTQHTVRA